ncbi:MAG: hypothetical protein ACKOJ9_03200 [Actinomycetota bacterium]
MSRHHYTRRELAFIAEALVRVNRRLLKCTLNVVVRDEVTSAFDEYLTRHISDLVMRYPSGTVFVDAVFTTKCIDALRSWRVQRGEGVRGERVIEIFDAALSESLADNSFPDPLSDELRLEAALIKRFGERTGSMVFRSKIRGEDTREVAADFGISRSRASHLINDALDELRGDDDWGWLE